MRTSSFVSDAARWQAVLDRDVAADGPFLYGVKTTGIYCRPTCPARRPKRENVVFFASEGAAWAAGYRACRRCQPDGVSRQQQIVAHIQHLLETVQPEPSLQDLAAAVGLSPTHVQRTFKQATGLSPKQYALGRREVRLKDELRSGKAVTTALYDAGYPSSRALYGGSGGLGMTPTSYRQGGKGQRVQYGHFDSSLGRMLIAATGNGVVALWFGEDEALLENLHQEYPAATLVAATDELGHYAAQVVRYLNGEARTLDLPLNLEATAFQTQVWGALRTIPYGETRSYGDIAEMIGKPTAVRAVARALATNPVALVIPCHRVVRAGGNLSGYRWGRDRKRRLLEAEQAMG